jgi:hypothetical protein
MAKIGNEYQEIISNNLYGRMPKAVITAIAVSHLVNAQNILSSEEINKAIVEEWEVLHKNGIVPQSPPSKKK